MTQHRLNVFIQPEHAKRLDELAAKKGVSKSSIVAAALASWLSPDAADQREAAIAKRLDRLSRQAERMERDQNIQIETLALFIRYYLTVSTPVPEARRMFRKSPYLDTLPVLSLRPEQSSRYRLRQSADAAHLCTLEVAALCLALAGEERAAQVMEAYLDVFTHHYLQAKNQRPVDPGDALHQRLHGLCGLQ